MYGWENALYANGLMSPWQNAWGGTAQDIVQKEVAPALGLKTQGENGSFSGYSTPGDPNAAAQTSQATKDRFSQGLTSGLGVAAGKAALGTGAALAAGMPTGMMGQAAIGSITSPGSIGGVLGAGVNAALGTQPQGFFGRAISSVAPIAGAMIGGPIGGLMGGIVGGPLADALSDAFDSRKNEALKDSVENNRGYFGGRAAVADMQSVMDKVNAVQSSVARNMESINRAREIAGLGRVGYSPMGMSLDTVAPGGYGLGGTGSSNTSGGWGGYDAGHASTGFGLGGRAGEVSSGALSGMGFGGIGFGGTSSGSGSGGSGGSSGSGRGVGGLGRGDSTGTGGGYGDGKGGVSGL